MYIEGVPIIAHSDAVVPPHLRKDLKRIVYHAKTLQASSIRKVLAF